MAKPTAQPSKAQPALWHGMTSTVGDARALLQRRVALFFFIQLVLSSASFLIRLLLVLVQQRVPTRPIITDLKQLFGHVIFTGLFLAIWLWCRKGERAAATVQSVEAAGTVTVCATCALPFLDPATGPAIVSGSPLGWQMFLIVIIVLVTRAALVPSSAARSLTIGMVSVLPISIATHGAINAARDLPFWSAPAETSSLVPLWGFSFVVVTAVTSRTIYGLQQRIRAVTRLGQYTLEAKLGEGGMGAVYRAHHVMMRRPTAVKLLPPDKAGEDNIARFEREVQLTATLTHPNTITIFDYGRTADGVFYYAMELLDGATIQDVVDRCGPLPPARVRQVLSMVAAALAEAHDKKLIHRDIKPTNILLCEQGGQFDIAKVLDFGLVKAVEEQEGPGLTQEGSVWGTAHYIAPEALTSPQRVDGRGDLYAVGAVGYYMLTGKPVFEGATAVEICGHHLHTPPSPPSERAPSPVPADLETIILDCLAKDPAERPQTAAELERRLHDCHDVGSWSRQQASAWWQQHGATLQAPQATIDPAEVADTIAVDLAQSRA